MEVAVIAVVVGVVVLIFFASRAEGSSGARQPSGSPTHTAAAPSATTQAPPDARFGSWIVQTDTLRPVFGGGARYVLMGHCDGGRSGISFSASRLGGECAIWPPDFASEQVDARITVRGMPAGETTHRGICQKRGTPMVLAPEMKSFWMPLGQAAHGSQVSLLIECGSYSREWPVPMDGLKEALAEWRARASPEFPDLFARQEVTA